MEKSNLRNHHQSNIIKYSSCSSWVSDYNNTSDNIQDSSEDLVGGLISWPPRSYTCTFCKREFRSAQALGGHMNVHRRDRARLRQIPSSNHTTFLNLNLHPNPNPNPNPANNFSPPFSNFSPPTTTTTMFPANSFISSSSSSTLCPTSPGNSTMLKKSQTPASIGVCKFGGLNSSDNEGPIVNKSEIVRLKLEIGLLGESRSDDLDLELRLSCS